MTSNSSRDQLHLAEVGLRVAEVPVRYRPRAGGRSKVSGSVPGTVRAVTAMAAVTVALLRERRLERTG